MRGNAGKLPSSGIYALILKLPAPRRIRLGALGIWPFARGYYVYVGSAQRALPLRLRRHARKRKPMRWHIDYLARHAEAIGAVVWQARRAAECILSDYVRSELGGRAHVPGFGSSDCRCPSHLYYFPSLPGLFKQLVRTG